MTFERTFLIRFAHCDPAGIVFYPQYFVLFNDHVEDWFAQKLGTDFAALHQRRSLGVPTVRIECDFANPSRIGDQVLFSLAVERLSNRSVTLTRQARVGDDVRVRMRQVLACVDLKSGKATQWPDDLREAMSAFLVKSDKSDN